jgi:hypothetical protein
MALVRGHLRACLTGRVQRAYWRWLHPTSGPGRRHPPVAPSSWGYAGTGGHPWRRCPSGCPARRHAHGWCPSWRPQVSGVVSTERTPLTGGVRGVQTAVQPGAQRSHVTLAESACGSAAACPHARHGSRPARGVRPRPQCPPHADRVHRGVRTACPHCQRRDRRLDGWTPGCPHCPSTTSTRQSARPALGQAADGQSADRSDSLRLPLRFFKASLRTAACGGRPRPAPASRFRHAS